MRHMIVVWNKFESSIFEDLVPLAFMSARNRALGSRSGFDVLFLEGMKLLSEEYREKLTSLGFTFHNVEGLFQRVKVKYGALTRFGDYEQKCFLRWLIIREYLGRVPFVHYDADIVFNSTPEELESQFRGLTFSVQGCPAYTRVEDPSWLENYSLELDSFVADMEAYSNHAWAQRRSFLSTYRPRNSTLWDRRILSSDQDLLYFLTLSGRIPHADAETVNAHASSALFQNPLTIDRDIHLPRPLTYQRRDGIDYIGGHKVAFWHMQTDFCDYLGHAAFRRKIGVMGRVPWHDANRTATYTMYRTWKKFFGQYTRGMLVRQYFNTEKDLGFLLNDGAYWKQGVFA